MNKLNEEYKIKNSVQSQKTNPILTIKSKGQYEDKLNKESKINKNSVQSLKINPIQNGKPYWMK
jgi:hypothetical protein